MLAGETDVRNGQVSLEGARASMPFLPFHPLVRFRDYFGPDAASRSASTFSAASRFACAEASIFATLAASRFACLAASRSALRAASPPPSPPPRARSAAWTSLSQRLLPLPVSPPRARLFAQRRAPPSRQLYASLARWFRASPSLLPRASPAAQLRAGLSPRRQALLARLRLRDRWPLA